MTEETKRYEFTGATKDFYGRTLRQIKSLVAIAALGVAPGDLGGWVETESNLPQDGSAWVFPNAQVCGKFTILRGGTFWGGTFEGGTFWGGTFRGGTFRGGTFWGGTFEGGTFWGGTFEGGTFRGGTFEGGTFEGGTFRGGTFEGGTFEGGTFRGGTFWGGTFWGGTFWGGTFWGGTFWGGTFEGGTFWGGTFWGGTFEGGTFRGGTFRGGTFWGGTFWGGTFWGGTSTNKQPVFLAGLRWEVTITDEHMTIGCQTHKLVEWWGFDDRRIARMDVSYARDFWSVYKPVLLEICRSTEREVEPA